MLPSIAYYLSRWYRRDELVFRLSCYIVMSPLAGAFGGLLASAILTMSSVGSLHTWKMIFAVEGIITSGLGLLAFFTMTDRPETAVWLTTAEKDLAIARVKAERANTTELLDSFSTDKILKGLSSPVTLVTAFVFLLSNITALGLAVFAPTIVRTIYPHHSVVSQQLYTVPPYIVGACFVVGLCFLSWRTGRFLVYYIAALPLTMIGFAIFVSRASPCISPSKRQSASVLPGFGSSLPATYAELIPSYFRYTDIYSSAHTMLTLATARPSLSRVPLFSLGLSATLFFLRTSSRILQETRLWP
jgi:hypothetical protein